VRRGNGEGRRERSDRSDGSGRFGASQGGLALVLVLMLALAGSVFAGCSAARTDVGTTDETCYLALPAAAHAVGHGAHFIGVRKYTMSSLKSFAPRLYNHTANSVSPKQAVCLAAYTGHFTSGTVDKPLGRPAGKLAVAVLTTPGNELLGTLILSKIPVRFQHTHPF
jgi:hypothetical protein